MLERFGITIYFRAINNGWLTRILTWQKQLIGFSFTAKKQKSRRMLLLPCSRSVVRFPRNALMNLSRHCNPEKKHIGGDFFLGAMETAACPPVILFLIT